MTNEDMYALLNSLNSDDLEATPTYEERLVDIAENQFDYPGYLLRILSGADAEAMYDSFPEICMELTKRFKTRDPELFMAQVRGMVEKWLYQDIAIEELTKFGLKFVLRGRDKYREIKLPKSPELTLDEPVYADPVEPTYDDPSEYSYSETDAEDADDYEDDEQAEETETEIAEETESDEDADTPKEDPDDTAITPTAYVYYNGKRMTIDMGIDKKGLWDRYKDVPFRQNIMEMLDEEAGLFLGFTVSDNAKYLLIDFNDDVYVSEQTMEWGTRPVYNLIENKVEMQPRDWETIANRIKSLIERNGKVDNSNTNCYN